jgi:hypothetical protein
MAATADPRAKPPSAAPHHLAEPWAHQASPAAHRMPSPKAAAGGGCGARDRRRSSSSHRRAQAIGAKADATPYDGGIEALRAKLMGHLRDAADRLREPHRPSSRGTAALPPAPRPPPSKATTPASPPPPPPGTDCEPELRAPPAPPAPAAPPQPDAATRPWNLRERTPRRPAAARSWAASPSPPAPPPSSRKRRRRAPFSVPLAAEEIEEDIYALTGARPRRRPRKRPRAVQRHVDVRRFLPELPSRSKPL